MAPDWTDGRTPLRKGNNMKVMLKKCFARQQLFWDFHSANATGKPHICHRQHGRCSTKNSSSCKVFHIERKRMHNCFYFHVVWTCLQHVGLQYDKIFSYFFSKFFCFRILDQICFCSNKSVCRPFDAFHKKILIEREWFSRFIDFTNLKLAAFDIIIIMKNVS